MKRILGWLTLMGLVLVLSSCSIWQSGLKPYPSSSVYRFPEGAELALLDNVETDDVADILGIKRWKFKFTATQDFSLDYALELRQPGQAARELFSSSSWHKLPEDQVTRDEEILLALQPLGSLGSTSYSEADKLKVFLRHTDFSVKSSITSVIDNPIKGMRTISRSFSPIKVEDDGAFQLMFVGKEQNVYPPNGTFLTFHVKLEPPRH